jgi:hypothetical protein
VAPISGSGRFTRLDPQVQKPGFTGRCHLWPVCKAIQEHIMLDELYLNDAGIFHRAPLSNQIT